MTPELYNAAEEYSKKFNGHRIDYWDLSEILSDQDILKRVNRAIKENVPIDYESEYGITLTKADVFH